MRVGFDFRPALKKNSRRRGIGRYVHELARALLDAESEHEFLLYTIAGERPAFKADFEARQTAYLKHPSRLNWLLDSVLLPRYIKSDRLQLFHGTELMNITRASGAQVWVTVHDLIPYIFWEETIKRVPKDFAYFLKLVWNRLAKADRIITDSEHSKQDICERLQIPAEKVDVVYLGGSENFRPLERDMALEWLQRKGQIEGPFLLYVGGSDYRKNLNMLVAAFSRIRDQGYPGRLVVIGETFLMDVPEVREIKANVQRAGLGSFVLFPGFVADEDLGAYYSACDFFVLPSLYEGFGLPVLEAMKCGAPLLLSRTSSLPEVAGDCAHYFEPTEMESLIEAFWKAYENPEEVEELRARGLTRAKRFTWQAAAQGVLELYNRHGL
jgi:glycosyltransferase involved in cell wall biosynthesis